MKVITVITALCASYAYGIGFDIKDIKDLGQLQRLQQQQTIKEEYKVPGANPLNFCEDPKDNILEIKKVDLSPNPPQAGKTLEIRATGDVKEKIEKGAKMHLQVKYGLITLINQEVDLCEQSDKVNIDCPVEKGTLTVAKDVSLPKEIPPGKYTVLADVFTKDNDKITCLTAQIQFHT